MARKSYKDLIEDSVKLQKRIKELKEKEASKIGNFILKEHPEIEDFNGFKKFYKANFRNTDTGNAGKPKIQNPTNPTPKPTLQNAQEGR